MIQPRSRPAQRDEVSIELTDLSHCPSRAPLQGIRAAIQDKRAKLNRAKIERRAGDGVGGGSGNYFVC